MFTGASGNSAVEDENIARAKAMLAAEGPHDGRERPKNDDAEFTDSRLSKRLAVGLEASGKPVLYVPGLGWLTWTGKLWEPTEEVIVKGVLKDYLLAWFDREVRAGVSADRRAHLNALLNDPRQNRLLSSLKAEVARKASDFDRHPDLLDCQNGVVNLRNGELLRHDPKLLLQDHSGAVRARREVARLGAHPQGDAGGSPRLPPDAARAGNHGLHTDRRQGDFP